MNTIKHIKHIAKVLLNKELHIDQTTEEIMELQVASSGKTIKLVAREFRVKIATDEEIKEDVPDKSAQSEEKT